MIKSLIKYLKKKQVIYQGFQTTNFPKDDELRIISKLIFSSGLSIDEIKSMRWENITVLENILLLNYKDKTKVAIASEYAIDDLLKLKHTDEQVFPECNKLSTTILTRKIDKHLTLAGVEFKINNVNSKWLQKNFINTIYIPKTSEELFNRHIINKIPIIENLNKKEFQKLLEIKSLI